MDIKYLKTNGLFGRYNHTIKFSDGVSIIIGDNGVGKTVCLKILKSLFNGDFGYLLRLDYLSIVISFGREIWTISKKKSDNKDDILDIFDDNDADNYDLVIESNLNGIHLVKSDDAFMKLPPYLEQAGENEWFDRRRGAFIDEKELFIRYRVRRETRGLPVWVRRRLNDNSVRLIDTQRIYRNENSGRSVEIGRTISKYVKDIAEIIRNEQNKAGSIAANLDRTFPSRLIEVLANHTAITSKATIDKLLDVDELSKSLHQVGLTEYRKDSILKNLQQIDDTILTVLSLYAEDMKKKLEAYSDIQGKLQLFFEIINARFVNKKCILNNNNEFCFVAEDKDSNGNKWGQIIEPSLLSSGEQNEFVLFYDLLFNCASKNLILIDEPELSLHIKWQQMMIGDLQRICEHNKLNILIATHSPDLIGNHWSLVQILN